ncbi:hypothetical protein [Microcoleus sp. B4-D4]|uniref:hypothetical protein n=1 Tax=Microcoleus sp. B4-D4 TaxID=2818667 RepID=UPI002FD4AAAF
MIYFPKRYSFIHPHPSADLCDSKVRARVAILQGIALSPIRIHQRASAVQKCDIPFLHPRPSACICGCSKTPLFRSRRKKEEGSSATSNVRDVTDVTDVTDVSQSEEGRRL